MNPLADILSSIDPSKARIFSATPPVQRLGTGSPKPATGRPPQRPAQPANGTPEASALKRKASNPGDVGLNKIPRKDAPAPLAATNGARSGSAPAGARSTSTTPTTSMPYRGTAGLGASKAANAQVKKPLPAGAGQTASAKTASSASRPTAPKPASAAPGASAAPVKKVGGYLAMLQKAKQKDATKPAAPPVKPEPVKIMSKKEREAARVAPKPGAKGKKPVAGAPGRAADPKAVAAVTPQEKRKPADLGYQGTARPAKKPVESGYKGTARSGAAAASSAPRPGASAAAIKKKPKPAQDRYAGYANWSDLDEMDDEEDDYASDGSSDMEGGIWDVEREEAEALKAAKREDAEALAEENALKREKEERRKKLAAMNKAAAAKKKY
ncbi:hypothetical protein P171DRAFT_437845 [Karstenula rhodostoma CBS 690.94]|uniref:SPT2-domain-containing protein n=1 Tax=Karstenula rhodostoma CBS 690.94 TaxID=1392251 RepID=A0A9P4P6N8_9PLEO|nr:hypothetical protein P171DRAFT_437845 [Karstenula rhodostoma CBS 690.94]